jgi:hypothetical protein
MGVMMRLSGLLLVLARFGIFLTGELPSSAEPIALSVAETETSFLLVWTNRSLTAIPPFLHYDAQLEASADLVVWQPLAAPIPGGTLAVQSRSHAVEVPKTSGPVFYRLVQRLNLPGAMIAGADLTGADLRGADLSGVDLQRARLDGADLSGATLSGAKLEGASLGSANLEGVNLDGLDLHGVDLGEILGVPVLTRLTADPAGRVAEHLPRLNHQPWLSDFSLRDPDFPGPGISVRDVVVLLRTNVVVTEFNALLARHGVSLVGSAPADGTLDRGLVVVRGPARRATELYDWAVGLNDEALVEAAVPNVLCGVDAITDDSNRTFGGGADWRWSPAGSVAGGNWGLEMSRVPQMWNFNEVLRKRGTTGVATGVIDSRFVADHEDLIFRQFLGPAPSSRSSHGMHVAGVIGATFTNDKGVEGVNPFSSLIAYTHRHLASDLPHANGPLSGFESERQSWGYRMIQDVRDLIQLAPDVRVINMSLGFRWSSMTPPLTAELSGLARTKVEFVCAKYGAMMAAVLARNPQVLIVCSAGNDDGLVPARLNSPMAYAGLQLGYDNVVVVSSHHRGSLSTFSNSGGDVLAPGEDILSSTFAPNSYATDSGTSMAAPFVAGLAGYLLAVDPALSPAEIKSLLKAEPSRVDAFSSVMALDLTRPWNAMVRNLLDIDDGTRDGNRRFAVATNRLGVDRSFSGATGPDLLDEDADGDGGPGDGVIDMSDFRRWRDWLLFNTSAHRLDGARTNRKHDANLDGRVLAGKETDYYPRGDFNGDGEMHRDKTAVVPGLLQSVGALSDLGVIAKSGIWTDPNYPDAQALHELVDTADVTVSGANFFYKYRDVPEVEIYAFDATSNMVVQPPRASRFSESNANHVITVPVGAKYYIGSQPVDLGGGINIQLRSIGEVEIAETDAGADYVVDLTRVEMTSIARLQNPEEELVRSDPMATNEVVAYLEGRGFGMLTNRPGALASCDPEATLYTQASASGVSGGPPPTPDAPTLFTSFVQWQRSFVKDDQLPDPEFLVKPMLLRLVGGRTNLIELNARAMISLEIRAYDRSPAWEPVFFHQAEIAGPRLNTNGVAEYLVVLEEGDLPPKELAYRTPGDVSYQQIEYKGTVPLDGIEDGHSFELRYRLEARVVTDNDESGAHAYVGDPLHYGSGTRMNYGSFGDLPRILEVEIDGQGLAHVRFRSNPAFYYRLYRATHPLPVGPPIGIAIGTNGISEIIDPSPPAGADPTFYLLENQPFVEPLDLDADGIDDAFELARPAILDPLDPTDASEDPDQDQRSNLAEYLGDTDPERADQTLRTVEFPGLVVDQVTIFGGVDLNGDGWTDRIRGVFRGITVELGTAAGGLNPPVTSELPDSRSISDLEYLDLDGDQRPEVLAADLLAKQLFVLRHTSGGSLVLITNLPAGNDPRRIVVGRLDDDALPDVVVMNENGRSLEFFRNPGDGTLIPQPSLRFADFGGTGLAGPDDVVIGDIDQDGLADLGVAASSQLAIFLGQGSFRFSHPVLQPILFDARRLYATDIDGDEDLDFVATSTTSSQISFLAGPGPGGRLASEVRYPVAAAATSVQFVDVDGDRSLDIVVDPLSAEFHSVLFQRSPGVFDPAFQIATSGGEARVIDWNQDQHPDLVTAITSGADDRSLVTLGRGNTSFDSRQQLATTNGSVSQVEIADLNMDGKVELVLLSPSAQVLEVWDTAMTNLDGTVGRVRTSLRLPAYVQQVALADANADGRLDAFVSMAQDGRINNPGTNAVQVLFADGALGWTFGSMTALSGKPMQMLAADFNGDGRGDFAVRYLDHLEVWTSEGTGRYLSETVLASIATPGAIQNMVAGDLNQDRRSELVLLDVGQGTRTFRTWSRDVLGIWTETQALAVPDQLGSTFLRDLDGDTRLDLLTSTYSSATRSSQVQFFPGTTTGFGTGQHFIEIQGVVGIGVPPQDMNGDGLADWIGGTEIRLAEPNGGFAVGRPFYGGPAGAQRVADINGDGKPDLLSWVASSGRVSILLQK